MITIDDFKGRYARLSIMASSGNGIEEIYECVPEKAIADIASEFKISNEEALAKLEGTIDSNIEICCPSKKASFWIEEIGA